MRYREANFVPSKSSHICSVSLELWYANRECEQDSRTYEHYYLTLVGTTKYGNRCNSLNISLL